MKPCESAVVICPPAGVMSAAFDRPMSTTTLRRPGFGIPPPPPPQPIRIGKTRIGATRASIDLNMLGHSFRNRSDSDAIVSPNREQSVNRMDLEKSQQGPGNPAL